MGDFQRILALFDNFQFDFINVFSGFWHFLTISNAKSINKSSVRTALFDKKSYINLLINPADVAHLAGPRRAVEGVETQVSPRRPASAPQ